MNKPWNRAGIRSWIVGIGLVAAAAGHASAASITVGSIVVLGSMLMQFWSKGYLHQNEEVTSTGPYRLLRHPFYFGNAILDIGIVLMSGYLPLLALVPIWWVAVYLPVMRREEGHMITLFGDQYRKYMERTPRFIPRLGELAKSLRAAERRIDWTSTNIVRTEIRRAFRYLTYPLFYILAWRLSQDGTSVLSLPELPERLAVAGLFAAFACSVIWTRFHSRRNESRLLPRLDVSRAIKDSLFVVLIVAGITRGFLDSVDANILHWIPGLSLLAMSIAFYVRSLAYPSVVNVLGYDMSLYLAVTTLLEIPWAGVATIPFLFAFHLQFSRNGTSAKSRRVGSGLTIRRFSGFVVAALVIAIAVES